MKRLFVNFMTFAAMATALTFTACSSDSDGDDNGNGNGGNGGGTGSSIVVGENILVRYTDRVNRHWMPKNIF